MLFRSLLIENAQQSRQAGAAVESFRNEVVKRQDAFLQLTTTELQNRALETKQEKVLKIEKKED